LRLAERIVILIQFDPQWREASLHLGMKCCGENEASDDIHTLACLLAASPASRWCLYDPLPPVLSVEWSCVSTSFGHRCSTTREWKLKWTFERRYWKSNF